MLHKLISWLIGLFFHLLYNQLAFLYDLVANVVSFGEWNSWIQAVEAFMEPLPTLELGFGPGHLQHHLVKNKFPLYGLDRSKYMTKLACRRLMQAGLSHHLVQASSSRIPFPDNYFDQVLSTFPSEYIFLRDTIVEVNRVLEPSGKLIILLMVTITGESLSQKFLNAIYRVTGQTKTPYEQVISQLSTPFQDHGLMVQAETIQRKFASLTFLIVTK